MSNLVTRKLCLLTKICIGILMFPFFSTAGLTPSPNGQLRTNLYKLDANGTPIALMDGSLTIFNNAFSNAVDAMDVRKMSNFTENLGMLREGQVLAIETRKQLISSDTVFYKMWQMEKRNYRFDFITTTLDNPGVSGFLEDKFLNTTTPLNLSGNNTVIFSITSNAGSWATDRFRIIFMSSESQNGIVPVRFSAIQAFRHGASIDVEWNVESEISMKQYEVEHSADGRNFTNFSTLLPGNSVNGRMKYTATDIKPAPGNNFYRIKGTSLSGKIEYSPVVKVTADKTNNAGISIYPNPVRGNQLNLQFSNLEPGKYKVRLTNYTGQQVYGTEIDVKSAQAIYPLQLNQKVSSGYYQLEVFKGVTRLIQKVVIE